MSEDRIEDLPIHRTTIEEAEGLLRLAKVAKAMGKILPPEHRKKIEDIDVAQLERLIAQMKGAAAFPDRFNGLFAKHGWIAHDGLHIPTAERAVQLAEAGKLVDADSLLADYWAVETIRPGINRLKRVKAFRARWRLAVDAESLYGASQFHASTLMVLVVLDGMVQEVSARHLGINQNFSAERTVLEAWDSIAGHSTGLRALKQLMLSSRKKTNEEQITIPYRHGIVHGMDVNFNSKIVAAKTWAALFAVGEWAYLAEQQKLDAPPPKADLTLGQQLRDTARIVKEDQALKQAVETYQPRPPRDVAFPVTSDDSSFEEGSPERALAEFLLAWQKKNYGFMARAITRIGSRTENPSDLRALFDGKDLAEFQVLSVRDIALARSEVSVRLNVRGQGIEWTSAPTVVLIKKLDAGTADEIASTPWTFSNYLEFVRMPRKAESTKPKAGEPRGDQA